VSCISCLIKLLLLLLLIRITSFLTLDILTFSFIHLPPSNFHSTPTIWSFRRWFNTRLLSKPILRRINSLNCLCNLIFFQFLNFFFLFFTFFLQENFNL
jgi:hypothetical protein